MKNQKLQLILTAMGDGKYRTLNRLALMTGIDSPAITALMRHIPDLAWREIGSGVRQYRLTNVSGDQKCERCRSRIAVPAEVLCGFCETDISHARRVRSKGYGAVVSEKNREHYDSIRGQVDRGVGRGRLQEPSLPRFNFLERELP